MKSIKLLVSLCLVFQSFFFITATTTSALGSGVVIAQILAGNSGAATQELVTLYNNSAQAVDVSGWCLKNKNNDVIGCIESSANVKLFIPAYQSAKLASTTYAQAHPTAADDHYDDIFIV